MPSIEELKAQADALGIKYGARIGVDALAARIAQQGVARQAQAVKEVKEKVEYTAPDNSKEEILEAIKPYLAKQGFQANIDEEKETWHFKYNGSEDSGNVHMPLRVIAQKAEFVARGRKVLMGMGKDNTYPGSYTDNILMG